MPGLDVIFLGHTLMSWLCALAAAGGALVGLILVRGAATRRLAAFARKTETALDDFVADLLAGTRVAFLAVVAAFSGSLVLGGPIQAFLGRIATLALLVQGAIWGQRAIAFFVADYDKRRAPDDPGAVMTVRAVGFVGRLVLWSLVLILALDNLGVDVTALVAGLGVGGLAVALAVQNILGDLFASLSIVLDKPFVQGDFIIVGDFMGVVDHVGVKTTRVRSLGGEQIIFSNADLLQSRIRNYKRMAERRVVFEVGVAYDTPLETLKGIPALLRSIVEANPQVRFDRAHFKTFGDYSLDFEVVYYVKDPDYTLHMDVQQAVNFEIMSRFEAAGIEFPYPTQAIQLVGGGVAAETASARNS